MSKDHACSCHRAPVRPRSAARTLSGLLAAVLLVACGSAPTDPRPVITITAADIARLAPGEKLSIDDADPAVEVRFDGSAGPIDFDRVVFASRPAHRKGDPKPSANAPAPIQKPGH